MPEADCQSSRVSVSMTRTSLLLSLSVISNSFLLLFVLVFVREFFTGRWYNQHEETDAMWGPSVRSSAAGTPLLTAMTAAGTKGMHKPAAASPNTHAANCQ